VLIAAQQAAASTTVSHNPTATAWILICGGVFELVFGPALWRNYRGIASKPHRGLGLRGQQRFGTLLTFAGPLTITLAILILLNRY
jgi:hypothetical protein